MHAFHVAPGVPGLIVGGGMFAVIGLLIYFSLQDGPFNLDPQNKWNAFEPFLAKYLRLGEFVVGLAAGSIVLLIGSSALHGPGLSTWGNKTHKESIHPEPYVGFQFAGVFYFRLRLVNFQSCDVG